MNRSRAKHLLLLAALVVGTFTFTGCQSMEEPGNNSSRPWNQPKPWEQGVPGFLQNDRRYR